MIKGEGSIMVNKDIIQRKLTKMSKYLDELAYFQDISYDEYLENFRHRRTVERLIQLIVDVAVDINSHVLVDEGYPPPEDSFGSFIKVGELGILSQEFAKRIAPSTGERNIIVHEYEKIDDGLVYDSIKESIAMYKLYISYYLQFITKLRD
jgi:uncharacterized protein YutE (UPF0331/DUF86 family)